MSRNGLESLWYLRCAWDIRLKHSGGDSSGTGGAAPAGAGGDGNCHVEAGSEVSEFDGTSDGVGYGILELRRVYRPRGAATARHVVGAGSATGSDIRQARQRRAPARLRIIHTMPMQLRARRALAGALSAWIGG